jgi:mRNA interferase MazF
MAIEFHPNQGAVLLCDYGDPPAPEMCKRRPVVVITPRLRHRSGLCTVVPLSSTDPDPPEDYHCKITFPRPLPQPWSSPYYWVKADMFSTVGFERLHKIGIGRDQYNKRKYLDLIITDNDLKMIQRCILHALHLESLTIHL